MALTVKLILFQVLLLSWTLTCSESKHKSRGWKSELHKYVTLNSGEKMPLVGYGTWQAEDKVLEEALDKALEAGYRHIDTATFYKNEHVIGNVLHKWLSSGKVKREDLFITTKLPHYGCQPELVSKYLEESLQNLQIDYLDLYLMHMPFYLPEADIFYEDGTAKIIVNDFIAVWKEMESYVDRGKIKSIGVSNFNETQLAKLLTYSRIKPSNLQVELHLYMQQKQLVEFCKDHRIAVTSFSTLGSRGSYQTIYKDKVPPPNMLENETVLKIAKKKEKTPGQILLRYMVQQNIAVIPKSTNEQRLKENLDVFSFHLHRREMNELCDLDQGEKGRILRLSEIYKGLEKHPNYPFPY